MSQLVTAGYFLNFHQNVYELTLEGYYPPDAAHHRLPAGGRFPAPALPETQLLQGRSEAYGVETMVSKKKGELTGWLNYTYARTLNQVYQGAASSRTSTAAVGIGPTTTDRTRLTHP